MAFKRFSSAPNAKTIARDPEPFSTSAAIQRRVLP